MNNPTESINRLVNRIRLYDLQTYLKKNGWIKIKSDRKKWQLFQLNHEKYGELSLILPINEKLIDSKERFMQAINALSQIEDRSPFDICMNLVSTNSDSLKIRLKIPNTASSLPIENASKHIKAIKNLLLYSACSEIRSLPHFEQPLPAAQEILKNFEFCHTFQGSFGFEISSTVLKENVVNDLFESSENRKIIERIARGLNSLNQAVDFHDPDILVNSYENALNARMCDAIIQIGLDGDLKFEIDIDWASIVEPKEDVSDFKSQFIGEAQISMLKYASEKLKIIEPETSSISGLVVNLHCVTNPSDGAAKRAIAVKVNHLQYGSIEVHLTLGQDQYQLALNAHSEGKVLIASGKLQRKGNTWSLDAITSIKVL